MVDYRSCRAWQTNADNGTKTCPAGFEKHFQSYMSTRQKCNPEYIPLYLRSSMNNYIVHDQRSSLKRPGPRGQKHDPHGSWWGNSENIELSEKIWAIKDFRTTQFSKRIKMESQVHFDLENFFHIKITNVSEETLNFNMRVWSWLRMNAGGVPNTCKSNGTIQRCFRTDLFSLVADGWVTRGQPAFHRGIAAGNGW